MKALLIGGTGFAGSYVAPRLQAAGYDVTCFVRPTSDRRHLPSNVQFIEGDNSDVARMTEAMRGQDVLVCVASIGFGHGPGIVEAARAAGIRRAVFVGTTAVFTTLAARTKEVRAAAEKAIAESGLDWTLIRPTMIYGSPRDRNMIRLIRHVQRWPFVAVAGSGEHLQQPVFVDDVAAAVVDSLRFDATIGRAYNISGAAPLTFNDVIDIVARVLGCRVRKIHIPVAPVVALMRAIERIGLKLPFKSEQIQRLNEDKAFAHDEAARDFHFKPCSFEEGIRLEVESARHDSSDGRSV